VDFLIRKGVRIERLINVCWDLNEKNMKRETAGLGEAMDRFDVTDAEIVTAGYDDRVTAEGKRIDVRNFFNWIREDV